MDYALPRAEDVPSFDFETRNVPCTTNALGMKGRGRGGRHRLLPGGHERDHRRAAGAPTASTHIDMPATPERVWTAIRGGPARCTRM